MADGEEHVYAGACHCGKVQYTLTVPRRIESSRIVRCNCTICHIHGYLMIYPLNSHVTFAGAGAGGGGFDAARLGLQSYTFHRHQTTHYFCTTCGTSMGGRPKQDPNQPGAGLGDIWALNARTLTDVDVHAVDILPVANRGGESQEVMLQQYEHLQTLVL